MNSAIKSEIESLTITEATLKESIRQRTEALSSRSKLVPDVGIQSEQEAHASTLARENASLVEVQERLKELQSL